MTIGRNFLEEIGKEPPLAQNQNTVDNQEPVAEKTEVKQVVEETKEPLENNPKEPEAPDSQEIVNTPQSEINDDSVKSYFKEKYGKEVEDFDSFFKEQPVSENPLDGVSDDVKNFIKFNKETNGRGYDEYLALNRDLSKLTPLDVAREKAIEWSKGKLNKDDVDEYLESKLNINLDDIEDIEKFDLMEIEAYGRDYITEKKSNQEKYLKPIEKSDKDFVTLDNGTQMSKQAYEQAKEKRNQYIESIENSTDKIMESKFQVNVDENGTSKPMNISLEHSKDDLHNMKSRALNIEKALLESCGDKNGEINPVLLQEGMFWINKPDREKAIQLIVNKALAEQAKDFLQNEHNVPVNGKSMPSKKNGGKRTIPVTGPKTNYGLKYDF